jgi:hypothetical protein
MSTTIRTRYIGPRGLRGAVIIARGGGRQRTLPYPHALPMGARAHAAAAAKLAAALGWPDRFTTTATADPSRFLHTVGV